MTEPDLCKHGKLFCPICDSSAIQAAVIRRGQAKRVRVTNTRHARFGQIGDVEDVDTNERGTTVYVVFPDQVAKLDTSGMLECVPFDPSDLEPIYGTSN